MFDGKSIPVRMMGDIGVAIYGMAIMEFCGVLGVRSSCSSVSVMCI